MDNNLIAQEDNPNMIIYLMNLIGQYLDNDGIEIIRKTSKYINPSTLKYYGYYRYVGESINSQELIEIVTVPTDTTQKTIKIIEVNIFNR